MHRNLSNSIENYSSLHSKPPFDELNLTCVAVCEATDWGHYHACDFEVLDELDRRGFEDTVRDLGRPVLLRNFAAREDRCGLRRPAVVKAHPKTRWRLGPIAYPNLVGATSCECLRGMDLGGFRGSRGPEAPDLDPNGGLLPCVFMVSRSRKAAAKEGVYSRRGGEGRQVCQAWEYVQLPCLTLTRQGHVGYGL